MLASTAKVPTVTWQAAHFKISNGRFPAQSHKPFKTRGMSPVIPRLERMRGKNWLMP